MLTAYDMYTAATFDEAGIDVLLVGVSLAAAVALGSGLAATLARVHVPLLAPSLATAALLVFVDVLKELPATLLLRPFNFDTLAVQAYHYASDERLAQEPDQQLDVAVERLAVQGTHGGGVSHPPPAYDGPVSGRECRPARRWRRPSPPA